MSVNPLTKPLAQFHSKFVSVLDELPQNGKALEITKRILIVVVSPFAYLALGFLSLVGQLYNSFSRDKKVIKPIVNNLEKMSEVKQSLLTEIINAKAINEIQSAKIFLNINVDGNKFIKDYVIKRIDNSEFDNEFLTQRIDSIMIELKELIQVDNSTELSIMWDALIKDKNVTFTRVHGLVSEGNSSTAVIGGNWKNIPLDRAEKVFEFVLKKMGREVVPQLNDQLEFA